MWDPREDAWFAGFADGEASFLIVRTGRPPRRDGLSPRFSLGLRADDLAVLVQLQDAFGGRLTLDARPQGAQNRPGNPRYHWHVVAKAELAKLVEYFDRFPLRAKKAADYAVWRRAVTIYIAKGGVETYEELDALRVELSDGRAYVEPAALRAVS